MKSPRLGLTLALLAFSQFMFAIDFNIVYVALPEIGGDLGFSPRSLQWVVSAYAVALGGLLLLGGRAVDRLGARRVFVFALGVYALSSLGGGLAGSPGVLVAARALQGVGGALLFPATLTLITTSFAEGVPRNRALAAWGAAGSAGLAAGALLGGVLTEYLGWEWVFYVNVPLAGLALAAAPRLLAADGPRAPGGFDVPGALLATGASTSVVFGLVSGPESGWTSVRGLGAVALGVALTGLFVLVESRAAEPLVPLRLFANRALVATLGVIFFFMGALAGTYYLLTLYLQPVLRYGALEAGLGFLPLGLLSMVGAGRLAPWMLARHGVRRTLLIGMLLSAAATGVLGLGMTGDAPYWSLLPGLALWGLFGGMTFTTMFVAAASGVPAHEQGVASGLASTFQQIGGAALLAAAVATIDTTPSVAPTVLADTLHPAVWLLLLTTSAAAFLALALPTRTLGEPSRAEKESEQFAH